MAAEQFVFPSFRGGIHRKLAHKIRRNVCTDSVAHYVVEGHRRDSAFKKL